MLARRKEIRLELSIRANEAVRSPRPRLAAVGLAGRRREGTQHEVSMHQSSPGNVCDVLSLWPDKSQRPLLPPENGAPAPPRQKKNAFDCTPRLHKTMFAASSQT